MLQKLRDKTTGWIATVVIGLLIIPFAFVGVNEYATGGSDDVVATVQAPPAWWQGAPAWWPMSMLWQEEVVTLDEFRTRFELVRMNQRESMGEAFDPRQFETQDNKLQVLQQLVDEKVLTLASRRAGVVVGDEAVRQAIAREPAFQVEGRFDASRYALMLSSQNPALTPTQFERQQRERMQLALIPQGIGESDFVTNSELERLIRLLGETRDAAFAAVPLPELDQAPVSDAEIQSWYQARASEFRQPEAITIEYLDIDGSRLPAAAAVDEAALRQRYQQEQARFMTAEQRLASHILVTVPADADDAARAAAESRAAALAAQARAPGADFAALAQANSEDPGSRDTGGDLGWVEKGAMVKPFEDALFGMQAGEVTGPVRTDFGYHVLQLREIRAGAGQSFEQVRDELAAEQGEVDSERDYNELAGRVVNEVLKNPTELDQAATAVGLQVQRLGPFSRDSAPGIAGNPALQRVAFSEAAIQDGTISDPIEIGPRRSVVLRVVEHTPEAARPLAEVRDAVVSAIRSDRRGKAAEAGADAILARMARGESLAAIAAEQSLETGEIPGIPRGAPVPSPAINQALFAVQRPAEGEVTTGKSLMEEGGYAVFEVSRVTEGDTALFEPDQRDQLQQQVLQMGGASAVESFVGSLRRQYRITVREDRL